MDTDAYLRRIGVPDRPAAPTLDALARLQAAHVGTVPFEDYDIHLGVPISLTVEDVHAKVVRRHRGGFCYELNGLFAALLGDLGFDVTLVSAFALDDEGVRGPDFEHLRLVVATDDGPVLADVGNGAGWGSPVPLRVGDHGDVRVARDGDLWWTSDRQPDGTWKRDWAWTAEPRRLADFTDRCRYQEHDPGSHFVARRLAVLRTDRGRISLVDGVFTEIVDGARDERTVEEDEERALLADRFGIVLDPAAAFGPVVQP